MTKRFAGIIRAFGAAVLVAAVSACASQGDGAGLADDPYQERNRQVHAINKDIDSLLLAPAAELYDLAAPDLGQHLLQNAFAHLNLPRIFVNDLLQGDLDKAMETLGRFGVNTIGGAGGLLDPATEAGLPLNENDFGKTLATYGVDEGVYLELPFFGPSTVRHTAGRIVDYAFNPTLYIGGAIAEASPVLAIGRIVDARHRNDRLINELLYKSLDSYVALRTAYLQSRRRMIAGGETDVEALPDIFSE